MSSRVCTARDRLVSRWLSVLSNHGRAVQTITNYTYGLRYFTRWLDALGIDFMAVTKEDAEQWISEMRMKGLDLSTISGRLSIARHFYRFLTAERVLERDPFLGVYGVKLVQKLPDVLTMSEVRRMFAAASTTREKAILHLLYSTGMRRGALLGINLEDLDLEEGTVRITTKGGKQQLLLLQPACVKAVKAWMRQRALAPVLIQKPTTKLLIGQKGTLRGCQLNNILKAIGRRAKIQKRIHAHLWRHTHATSLIDNGVAIEDVAHLMGHSKLTTTMAYIHLSTVKIRKAWQKLPPV